MKKSSFCTLALLLFSCMAISQGLRVGTYNIRYANRGDSAKGNGWGQRVPVITSMIRFHNMDIFGTQEGLYGQLQDMLQGLPGYAYVGAGRDDGQKAGEHSAIFYRTDKFELLESGDFWLSTVTDKPNKGWDAALPRICTWGKFRTRGDRFVFYMFNLHMDHVGVIARKESARLILQKIKDFPKDIPAILTGDFNVDQFNESYQLINQSGILRDAYEAAPVKLATTGTFNAFDPDANTGSRIDHIFISKQFAALRYGILTDSYRSLRPDTAGQQNKYVARTPSDHFPVLVELTYRKK